MKNRRTVFRGCPLDAQPTYRCPAYKSDGPLCLETATVFDPQRGAYVCEAHAQQLVMSLTVEATGFKV